MKLNSTKPNSGLKIISVHYDINEDGTYCMTEIVHDCDGREMEIQFPSANLYGEIMGWGHPPVGNELLPDKVWVPQLFPFLSGSYNCDENGNFCEIRGDGY